MLGIVSRKDRTSVASLVSENTDRQVRWLRSQSLLPATSMKCWAVASAILATSIACSSGGGITPAEPPELLARGAYLIIRTPADSILQTVPPVVGAGCTTFTGTLRVGSGDSALLVRQYVVPPNNGVAGAVTDASPGRARLLADGRVVLLFADRADTAIADGGVSPRTTITLNEHFPMSPPCNPKGVYIVTYSLIT